MWSFLIDETGSMLILSDSGLQRETSQNTAGTKLQFNTHASLDLPFLTGDHSACSRNSYWHFYLSVSSFKNMYSQRSDEDF